MLNKIKEFIKKILGIDVNKNQYFLEADKGEVEKFKKSRNMQEFKNSVDARNFVKAVNSVEELIKDEILSADEISSIIDEVEEQVREEGNNEDKKENERNFYKETSNGTTVIVHNMAGGIISTQPNARNTINMNINKDLKSNEEKEERYQSEEFDGIRENGDYESEKNGNDTMERKAKLRDTLKDLNVGQVEEIKQRVNSGIISIGDNCKNTILGREAYIVSKGKNNINTLDGEDMGEK